MTFATPPPPSSLYDTDALVFGTIEQFHASSNNKRPCEQTKKTPGGTKRNVQHHHRQKLEKEALIQQLATLDSQLQQEKENKRTKSKSESLKPTNSMWKAIARRHLESLSASEARRTWLQTAVSGKNAQIGDFVNVVRQQMKLSALIAAHPIGGHVEFFLKPSDDSLYAMDMRDISALYKLTDMVFSASRLDPTSADTTMFQRTVTKRAGGVSIQFVRRQHMLFNYEDTCQSIWMLSHLFHRQEDRVDYPAIQDPVNTIATKFRITKRLPDGEQLSLKERIVACRFVERGRTVLVWKATLTGEGSCAGMQTDETGWSVIRPSTTGSGTMVEVCMRQGPAHLHTIVDPPVANRFDNFLQSITKKTVKRSRMGRKQCY